MANRPTFIVKGGYVTYFNYKRFNSMAYSSAINKAGLISTLFLNVDYQLGFGSTQGSGDLPTEMLKIIRCWKQKSIINQNE
jgi:hypothetical protein